MYALGAVSNRYSHAHTGMRCSAKKAPSIIIIIEGIDEIFLNTIESIVPSKTAHISTIGSIGVILAAM